MMKRLLVTGFALGALYTFSAAPALADEAKKAPAATTKAAETKAPAAAPAADAKAKEAGKPAATSGTIVEIKTSEGTLKIELDDKNAPVSAKNFAGYVADKFYDGTVFHRVIDGFMVQGGGFTADGDKLSEKPTKAAIVNEGKNGLKNDRGTVAMARTPDPNSATAQFFINLVNNDRLNFPNPDGHGYAVFGKVVEGMDVVDKIAKVKTGMKAGMGDVPVVDIKILSATIVKSAAGH